MEQLVESIRTNGVLNPIIVTPKYGVAMRSCRDTAALRPASALDLRMFP